MKKFSIVAVARPSDHCEPVERSFAGLDYPPAAKELIIVRGRRPAAQRNEGAARASGDFVVFSDDDVALPPDHLRKAAGFFEAHPDAGALGGPVLPAPGQSLSQSAHGHAIASRLLSGGTRARYARVGGGRCTDDNEILSCNLIVPKKVIEEDGGFNERLYPGEDVEFIRRIGRRRCVYHSPDMAVSRPMRRGLRAHLKMFFNYGRRRPETEFRLNDHSPVFMAPTLFLIYLLLAAPLTLAAGPAALAPLAVYALLLAATALNILVLSRRPAVALLSAFFILAGHAAYGAGYAAGWLRRAVYYPRLLLTKGGGLPAYLIFYVTNRCNMRCGHCFYWKDLDGPARELSAGEIEKACSSMGELLHVILTGGEPYLRRDLGRIIEAFHARAGAKVVTIPSNGSLKEEMLRTLVPVLKQYPGLVINQNVSFDGMEAEHDRVRRTPGAWRRAAGAFRALKKMREEEGLRNLNLGIVVTFTELNQDDFPATVRGLFEELGPDSIAINLVRGDPREKVNRRLDIEKYAAAVRERDRLFFSRGLKGAFGFRFHTVATAIRIAVNSLVERTWREGRFQVPCYACRSIGVVYPGGEVFPCELLPRSVGSLKESDFDLRRIWSGPAAAAERKLITESRCFCTHECFMQTNVLFNPRLYPGLAWNVLRLLFPRRPCN